MRTICRIFAFSLVLAAASAALGAETITGSGVSIGETPFTPRLDNPLTRLDLIPESLPATPVVPRLDPRGPIPGLSASLSIPRRGIGDGLFEASAITLIALNVADYFSTREALRYPGLREGNPLLQNVVHDPAKFAAVKIGFAAASYISLKSLYKRNRTLGWAVSTLSNFALSCVVVNNIRQIGKARARTCVF